MAESTLSLSYEELANSVAHYLGWGRDVLVGGAWSTWSSDTQDAINRILRAGLRLFYFPAPVAGIAHRWSFLRPITTLDLWATASGTMTVTDLYTVTDTLNAPFLASMVGQTIVSTVGSYVITAYTSPSTVTVATDATADNGNAFTMTCDGLYRLPDDFGSFAGPLTFTSQTAHMPVCMCGEAHIRVLTQRCPVSGRPRYGAVRPCVATGTGGQRYDMLFYPTPNGRYTLAFRYQMLPGELTAAAPYPAGGMLHGETIKYACLAAAEAEYRDGQSEMMARFAERLQASIHHDRISNAPEHMPYNADWEEPITNICSPETYVTYNGVMP
ncbi:MAG: hypothetical protein AB1508_19005 [Pseudomonadota bacterium]